MWNLIKLNFLFYDFSIIFNNLIKINLKKKDKIFFKTAYNTTSEVRWTILKVEGDVLSGFRVKG
jgi:hypothetical protein